MSCSFVAPAHVSRFKQRRSLSSLSIRHFAPRVKNPKTPRANVAAPDVPAPANIAIIGSGLAGLATAYHLRASVSRLLRKRGTNPPTVTVISPKEPGTAGASPVAAGLLHPFTPRVKKFAWGARKGIAAAEHLLQIASTHASDPIFVRSGLLRLALSDRAAADFRAAANRFPSLVEYLDVEETSHRFPQVAPCPSAFLSQAIVVDTPAYLKALWATCRELGVHWHQDSISAVADIIGRGDGRFDAVIVCAGAESRAIRDIDPLPLTPCRGQNLLLRPQHDVVPQVPVISGKYVVPDYFGHGVLAGATFEYAEDANEDDFLREGNHTDPTRAVDELRQPLHNLLPGLLDKSEVIASWAGLRALPPRSAEGSVPIACRVQVAGDDISAWLLSGLGSRGLLHHAYLGRMMAHAVVASNERLIPMDARRFDISLRDISPVQSFEEEQQTAIHAR